jgi:hypothetical protein
LCAGMNCNDDTTPLRPGCFVTANGFQNSLLFGIAQYHHPYGPNDKVAYVIDVINNPTLYGYRPNENPTNYTTSMITFTKNTIRLLPPSVQAKIPPCPY